MPSLFEGTLLGHLGSDAEMRYTPNGAQVTQASIAADVGFGDKRQTVWVRVSAFGKTAEVLSERGKKGALALVIGDLQPLEIWTGRDGTARCEYRMVARTIRITPRESKAAAEPEAGVDDLG